MDIEAEDLPQKFCELLQICIDIGASDMHLSAQLPPRFRVNGQLMGISTLPDTLSATELAMWQQRICDALKMAHANTEIHDYAFSVSFSKQGRFRVQGFQDISGAALVCRHLPCTIPTLDTLSAPDIFKQLLIKPQGLILLTGATGSGKSTTLAAMVDYLNNHHKKKIICLEDPIEYLHKSRHSCIHQRQIGVHCHSYQDALINALRQDPDVILIGEMRDKDTMGMALSAAETGHLVMATLHTQSAAKAINRFVDAFSDAEQSSIRAQLSHTLVASIWQQLCVKHAVGEGVKENRVAAFEVLINNEAVANLIRQNKIAQIYSIQQTHANLGMQTMEQAMVQLTQ